MASLPEFQPFVPANETRPEFTVRAILLGCIFGVLFGAVTVYVGLRAGLTVAASIPISVLSISVLRALGRASIFENNIVLNIHFPQGSAKFAQQGRHRLFSRFAKMASGPRVKRHLARPRYSGRGIS